jgi:hypothetical protein
VNHSKSEMINFFTQEDAMKDKYEHEAISEEIALQLEELQRHITRAQLLGEADAFVKARKENRE